MWLQNYKVKAPIHLILRSWWNHLLRPHLSLAKAKCSCWVSTLPSGGDKWRDRQKTWPLLLKIPTQTERPGISLLWSGCYQFPTLPTSSAHHWGALWRHFDPSFTSQIQFLKTCSDQDCTPTCNQHYLFTYLEEVRRIHPNVNLWLVVPWIIFILQYEFSSSSIRLSHMKIC